MERCWEGQGMVSTLLVRTGRGERALGEWGNEMRGGRCTCGHVHACLCVEVALREGGWMDTYGLLDTEQGPLPLSSHLDVSSSVCGGALLPTIFLMRNKDSEWLRSLPR